VVLLAGQPLHTYIFVRELLKALRDAIIGHRSLLNNKKILYKNISKNNIIFTDFTTKKALKRRLINLDLAKKLDSILNKASHRTNTIQFITIKVLKDSGYTYYYNLKLFFYVLFKCVFNIFIII
jgi:hypothetical protein